MSKSWVRLSVAFLICLLKAYSNECKVKNTKIHVHTHTYVENQIQISHTHTENANTTRCSRLGLSYCQDQGWTTKAVVELLLWRDRQLSVVSYTYTLIYTYLYLQLCDCVLGPVFARLSGSLSQTDDHRKVSERAKILKLINAFLNH